jgi:hypothetical protein
MESVGRTEISRTVEGKNASLVLEVQPPVAVVDEEITWVLHNTGDVAMSYGRAYDIQQQVGGSWVDVPNHLMFTLDLPGLYPGKSTAPSTVALYDESGNAAPFEPGTHRFILRDVYFWPLEGAENFSVMAEFRVRSDD